MLKGVRQRRISQIIQAQGQASVNELARRFHVTEMTIRRDLGDLDAQGFVQRIHGGAISTDRRPIPFEPPMLERMKQEADAKRRIGRAVAAMVSEGENVFLGSGTTTLAVAEALSGRSNLTVITNALTIANALVASNLITLIVVGGFLRRSELSLIGHFAETTLHDLRVDKVIMGIRGIDANYGLTSDHFQELMTDRAIMAIGESVIIVADHTKFGHVAASRTAPVNAAKVIVTDSLVPDDVAAGVEALGVRVIRV